MPPSSQNNNPNSRDNRRIYFHLPAAQNGQINYATNKSKPADENKNYGAKIIKGRQSKWTDPNVKVAILGLLVNIGLGVFTIKLFNETVKANGTSIEALKVAKNANDETKKVNERNYQIDTANDRRNEEQLALAKRSFDSTIAAQRENQKWQYILASKQDEKDKLTLNIAKKSLDAQIGSISEMQRQFKIGNIPYLFFDKLTINNLAPNKQPYATINIINARSTPVKIIRSRFGLAFDQKSGVNPDGYLARYPYNPVNIDYITNQSSREFITNAIPPISKSQFDSVAQRKSLLLVFGEVEYFSELDSTIRVMKFNTMFYDVFTQRYWTVFLDNYNIY